MGLDAYIFSTSKKNAKGNFDVKNQDELEELVYWRKFWGLHNWMLCLANRKGLDEDFNGVFLRLTRADIKKLNDCAVDLTAEDSYDGICLREDAREYLFRTIAKCYNELEHGRELYYYGDY